MDQWRVTVLGDGNVGKTALAVQFTMNAFVETYDPTIEDSYRKQIVVDDRMCFIEVIDTAGQEEYATLREQWVREGQGFVLVYAVDSRRTFNRVEIFYNSMMKVRRGNAPSCILVANKTDKTPRTVTVEEGMALARRWGCDYVETSAKTASRVDEAFTTLIRTLRIKREDSHSAPTPPTDAARQMPQQSRDGGYRSRQKKKNKGCIVL